MFGKNFDVNYQKKSKRILTIYLIFFNPRLSTNKHFDTAFVKYCVTLTSFRGSCVKKKMLVRSEWCTHQHSCLEAAFRGWGTVFGITTSARLLWCGLYRRIFGEKTYQPTTAYLTASTGHDVIPGVLSVERVNNEVRLGLFLSTLVGSIKGINCAMRLIRQKEDSWNSIVAGAVGGKRVVSSWDLQNGRLVYPYLWQEAKAGHQPSCLCEGLNPPI